MELAPKLHPDSITRLVRSYIFSPIFYKNQCWRLNLLIDVCRRLLDTVISMERLEMDILLFMTLQRRRTLVLCALICKA